MAISLVGTASATGTGDASVVITLPVGIAENDVVVVSGGHTVKGSTDPAVSTSGYTQLRFTDCRSVQHQQM